MILHGSLTLDDYVPGRSDVDLLVVVDDPLSDAQLAALTDAVAVQRPRAPGRVDLRVVTREVAASPTPAPRMEAYLRLTPGSGVRLEERRHPGNAQLADWQAIGDDPPYAELRVLTACRVWRFAGEWALQRDPSLQVVRDALHQRHRDPAGPIDPAQVQQLLTSVRARLAEARDAN